MGGHHDEDWPLALADEAQAREPLAARLAPLWAALVAMAPFVSVLTGGSEFFHDDHFRFSTPLAGMFAEAIRAGHLPLWNPWILTGTPLLSERGSMLAHPGMFLALVMAPSHAVGTLLVLLLGVLAAGATALLRALGVRAGLAVALGAACGLGGPALSYTGNAPFLATLAFWPLILLAALRLAAGGKAVWHGGVALGMALLGGDLPGALLAALVALLVFRAAGGRLATAWPRLFAVLGLALVIGAGSTYPVLWGLPLSERGVGIAASEAGRWSFHPAELVGFLWPHPLGLPLPRFTFWPYRWLGERLFLHSVWIGALVAAASILTLRRGAPRVPRTFALAALGLLILATGEWTPLWPLLRPLFTYLRYPSKLAAPAALLLALAGGVMLERLLGEPRRLRNLALVVAGLGALGASLGPVLQGQLARRAGAEPVVVAAAAAALRVGTGRVALLALAVVALSVLVARGRLALPRAAAGLALLLFLDVAATTVDLSWTRTPLAPPRPSYLPEAGARGPRVMRLAEVTTGRVAYDEPASTDEQMRQAALLSPMTNARHHAAVLEPYGLYLGEVAQAMAQLAANDPLALAELTATDVVLAAPGSRGPWLAAAVASQRLRPTAAIRAGAVVLRPAHALPRSFVASAARLAPAAEMLQRRAAEEGRVLVDARRGLRGGAFVALPAAVLPAALAAAPPSPPVPVAPLAWRPGEASYKVASPTPALLVEVDAFAPGWQVFVDGQERTALQANVFGRAVALPPGEHLVTWRFCPRLPAAALWVSWLGLLVGVAGLLLRRRAGHA
jgi:hypothetical protein